MQRQSRIRFHDSGVPWIGTIPATWELIPLKRLGRFESGENITAESIDVAGQYPVYGGNGLRGYTESYSHEGDYVLVGRQGALCGNVNYASGKFWASEHAVTVKPKSEVAVQWLGELLRAMNLGQYSQSAAQPGLSVEFVVNLKVPVPPPEEQRAIAAFLDRKTAQIDAVVAKKQRLIERLQEKRQALISHAVTKGLDPHAPMKVSGIEWLGEIPRHWSAERLKFSITKIEQGWSPQCDNRQAEDGEWGVLKVGCVNRSEFDSNEQKALPEELAPVAQYEIGEGDILMSRGNTRELVGSAALVKAVRPKLLLCDLLYRFRSLPQKADSQFLVLQLRSPVVRYEIEREATGTSASMKKIGQETIRSFWIVLPPIEEQRRIIAHIAEQAEYIDKMTDRIRTQIAKLQEYRQTLISAAVTGKIDVTKEAEQ